MPLCCHRVRRRGQVAAVDRGAAGGVGDDRAIAEELAHQLHVRRLATAGAGPGVLEERLGELAPLDRLQLQAPAVQLGEFEEVVEPFPLTVEMIGLGLHVDCPVFHLFLRMGGADVDTDPASRAVVRRHLNGQILPVELTAGCALPLEAGRGHGSPVRLEFLRIVDLDPNGGVGAHEGAAGAVDADVWIPDRDVLCDRALLVLGGAGREGAVDGKGRNRKQVALAFHHDGGDPLHEVRCNVRYHRALDDLLVGGVGYLHLGQTVEASFDRRDVAADDHLAPLAVGLLDLRLDGVDRLVGGNDPGDCEEAGLEHGVDPSAEPDVSSDALGVNDPERQLLVDDLTLHIAGEVIPHVVRTVRAIEEEGRSFCGFRQYVDLLEEDPLVTRNERCVVYQVGGRDRVRGEAEMRDGLGPGFLGVVFEVALHVEIRVLSDDLHRALVCAHGPVRPQAVEQGPLHRVWLLPSAGVVVDAQMSDVVVDADREAPSRLLLAQLVEDPHDHCRCEFLGGEAVPAGHRRHGPLLLDLGGEHVEIQRVAGRTRFLRSIEHRHRRGGARHRVEKSGGVEGSIEPDDDGADLLTRGVEGGNGLAYGSRSRPHDDDDPFGIGRADVVEQPVRPPRQLRPAIHLLLDDVRSCVIEGVARLARLEEHVRILRRTTNHRVVRIEGANSMLCDQMLVDHPRQHLAAGELDLCHFVAGAEAVEEVEEGDPASQGRGMGDGGEILGLLDRSRRQHRPPGLTGAHDIGVVTEDRECVGGDRSGGDVDHGRRELAGDLVHVGQHQQQALGRGEGRRQRPGLE